MKVTKRSTVDRTFRCPTCGTIQHARKLKSMQTKEGHIKDMWCFCCKDIKKMVQLRYY